VRFAAFVVAFAVVAVSCKESATGSSASPSGSTSAGASAASTKETVVLDAGAAANERGGGGVRVVVAPADADAIATVRTERLRAKNDGRVLVLYVGAGWCEPCRAMKREIESGRLDARLAKVTLLAFDADRDADRLAAGGYAFKFIPYVALPGSDGHVSDSQEAKGHGKDAWRELLAKLDDWQASPH
jgi:hypothetical protein